MSVTPLPQDAAAPEILVVDDEMGLRMVMKMSLETAGFRVRTAEGAATAISEIKERAADLVLLDYRMPGKNGIELAREIRELEPDATLALCSAHIDPEVMVEGLKLGIVDFMLKPVSVQILRDRVNQILKETSEGKTPVAEVRRLFRQRRFSEARRIAVENRDLLEETDFRGVWLEILDEIDLAEGSPPIEVVMPLCRKALSMVHVT